MIGYLCPPLHVATELRGEASLASPLVPQYGVQLAEEEYDSQYIARGVLAKTLGTLRGMLAITSRCQVHIYNAAIYHPST
jgi:hypothetical protein